MEIYNELGNDLNQNTIECESIISSKDDIEISSFQMISERKFYKEIKDNFDLISKNISNNDMSRFGYSDKPTDCDLSMSEELIDLVRNRIDNIAVPSKKDNYEVSFESMTKVLIGNVSKITNDGFDVLFKDISNNSNKMIRMNFKNYEFNLDEDDSKLEVGETLYFVSGIEKWFIRKGSSGRYKESKNQHFSRLQREIKPKISRKYLESIEKKALEWEKSFSL